MFLGQQYGKQKTRNSVAAVEHQVTVNLANNDCGYNDNSRTTTEFPRPEQSPFYLYTCNETSGITTLRE